MRFFWNKGEPITKKEIKENIYNFMARSIPGAIIEIDSKEIASAMGNVKGTYGTIKLISDKDRTGDEGKG